MMMRSFRHVPAFGLRNRRLRPNGLAVCVRAADSTGSSSAAACPQSYTVAVVGKLRHVLSGPGPASGLSARNRSSNG